MPYTIVLAPPADQSMKYVETSQALYSNYQPSYLLAADGTSSPHITVVQFDCDLPDLANKVWVYTCDKMRKEKFEPFAPPFMGMSFIEGAGSYEGTTWVELSVKRGDENSPIMRVHYAALEALKHFNLEPLNAVGSNYRPHLTLARIVMPKQMEVWSKNLYANTGNFNLEFGLSDEKWQYADNFGIYSGELKK
ncbi:MAG: hypothetical protein WA347_08920 [Rhabdochlamydiaceae bacterium]|jgi:hypothetical protein